MFVNCITRNRKHPTLRAISVKYETKDKKKRARILWISRYYFYISVKVLKTHQSIRVKKIVLVPFEVKSRNPSEIYDKGYQLFYIYRSQWGIQKYDIISHTIGTQQSKQKAKLLSHTPPHPLQWNHFPWCPTRTTPSSQCWRISVFIIKPYLTQHPINRLAAASTSCFYLYKHIYI